MIWMPIIINFHGGTPTIINMETEAGCQMAAKPLENLNGVKAICIRKG